jgi:hypothetical protein
MHRRTAARDIERTATAKANLIRGSLVPFQRLCTDGNDIGQSTALMEGTSVKLEYVPLLQVQRELQDMPREYQRFRQYLRTITAPDGRSLELPSLLAMNPMGKEHVTDLLDALLTLNADGIAARATADASAHLKDTPGGCKITLVIADDLKGGWTNRYANEFTHRFQCGGTTGSLPRWLKHFWITGLLWSSEPASERAVREAVLTAVYRTAFVQWHGPARTLRQRLAQEGAVMTVAGCTQPALDPEDIAYTREVLAPLLETEDMRTCIECLFGDAAGRTLGFTPRGLSPWAGLVLALHDAQANTPPV